MSPRSSPSPGPYVPNPESLILPDGAVGEQAVDLLEEFVHPHQHEVDVDADYHLRRAHHRHLPWWKTPSPWWLLAVIPFTSIAMSATIAPRIEIYTLLVCSILKPDIFHRMSPVGATNVSGLPGLAPAVPPTISNSTTAMAIELVRLISLNMFDNSTDTGGSTCAADPVVQAAVAKLAATYTSSMGILSCITAGWWGSYSDRHGRTRLLSISVIGLLFTDLNFIFTTRNFQKLPGGYWFVVLGPLVEGSLGGVTASIAAIHAYVADTTTESARSRTLSLSLGLLFMGMAIGPTLGGLLIRISGSPLSVFYAALCVHLVYAVIVSSVLPESLLKSQMEQSREKYNAKLRDSSQSTTAGSLIWLKRVFAFLSPLSVFLPELRERIPGENPLKRKGWDWNLTIVAGAYALALTIMGSYTTKFQYAAATFGWSSETMGYFLTLVGATRAVFLTVILPSFIKFFKPQTATPPRGSEAEPLLSGDRIAKVPHSSSFDLGLARVSLFVEVIAYGLMALAPTALVFTGFSMFASMGAGLNPALQSVSLALYRRRGGTESGRLFGALSVLQALSSQIIGPAMYGLVYMKTVATFSRAIFILSTVTIASSFVLLAFVRLPSSPATRVSDGDTEEATSTPSEI